MVVRKDYVSNWFDWYEEFYDDKWHIGYTVRLVGSGPTEQKSYHGEGKDYVETRTVVEAQYVEDLSNFSERLKKERTK